MHYDFSNTCSTITRHRDTSEAMPCHLSQPKPQMQQCSLATWCGDLSRYSAPLLNKGNILSFGDDMSGGFIKNLNPNLISKLLPLKTTIDIPIIISYITKLQHIKFGL